VSFYLNGRWISYGDFCYDGCGCEGIRFDDLPYLVIHEGETESPASDEERVSRIDNLKLSPPSPNKLLDITFDLLSAMVLRFVKRFWRLEEMEDWHFHHWQQAKFILLMSQCRFPPVVANYTLPALDYLWPCVLAQANGVVRDPQFWVYIGWNDVTYLWSLYDRHFVGQDRRTVRS